MKHTHGPGSLLVSTLAILLLATAMLQAGTARAAAGSVFVVTNTNDSGDGSLRQAIATANADPAVDVINFNIGTGLQIIELASSLPAIISPIDIHGGSQPGFSGNPLITIDCGGILGCTNLWVSGASVQVSAVELTGGHGTKDFGGALNNFGGTVTLSNVGVAFNTGGGGGGIFNADGAVDIIHSRIGFNTASVGGGKLKGHVAYCFLLTAPNGKPDALRIKIWDTATGAVVYDNQPGAADGAAPTAPLGGGNIIIH